MAIVARDEACAKRSSRSLLAARLVISKAYTGRRNRNPSPACGFETPFCPAISTPLVWSRLIGLTGGGPALKIEEPGTSAGFLLAALPPRSMVGQLPLEQHIGVRIPGGQPLMHFPVSSRTYSSTKNLIKSVT